MKIETDEGNEDELVPVLISRGQGGRMGNETMRQLPAVGEETHPQTPDTRFTSFATFTKLNMRFPELTNFMISTKFYI